MSNMGKMWCLGTMMRMGSPKNTNRLQKAANGDPHQRADRQQAQQRHNHPQRIAPFRSGLRFGTDRGLRTAGLGFVHGATSGAGAHIPTSGTTVI